MDKLPGERALTWAKAVGIFIPLLGATITGVVGYFKSDDAQSNVEDQWEKLEARVLKHEKVINKQSDLIEKLTRRMVFFQGHQEGMSAGRLFEQKTQLEKQIEELRAKRVVKVVGQEKLVRMLQKLQQKKKQIKSSGDSKIQQLPRLLPAPFKKGH